MVREVETVTGGIITINDDPAPDGVFIPWASNRVTGMAQARRITIPIPGEVRWAEHACH